MLPKGSKNSSSLINWYKDLSTEEILIVSNVDIAAPVSNLSSLGLSLIFISTF